MLRRIPVTPLVYLAILLITLFADGSWAAAPDESMEILLKPNPTSSSPIPDVNKAKSRDTHRSKRAAVYGPAVAYFPPPAAAYGPPPAIAYVPPPPLVYGPSPAAIFPLPAVSKVKGGWLGFPVISDCILPTPAMGQWEMEAGVIFARLRGKVTCNQNIWTLGIGSGLCSLLQFTGGFLWNQDIDFTGIMGLPVHQAVGTFSARYQFRPNWAFRYQFLGFETTSSGMGDWWAFAGWGLNTKWNHYYHRLGIVYDAVRNCKARLSVFADWVHTDDTLTINCSVCSFNTFGQQPKWGKNGDSMIAGLELQRCIRVFANGGTLSLDCRAGGIFLDNVEGSDLEAGARYSIPLNCGRSGYVKGGYRVVDIKKSQNDFGFNQALEGGFMSFGFIF